MGQCSYRVIASAECEEDAKVLLNNANRWSNINIYLIRGIRSVKMKKTNIVLIMADDMGFSDIGCFGSEIETKNLDSLAKNGLKFSQMYNCARCCPTRASLLTGLSSHKAGIGLMTENLGTKAYQGFLRDDCVTIAEVLKTAGYKIGRASCRERV